MSSRATRWKSGRSTISTASPNLGFTNITLTVGFIQSLNGIFILAFTPW